MVGISQAGDERDPNPDRKLIMNWSTHGGFVQPDENAPAVPIILFEIDDSTGGKYEFVLEPQYAKDVAAGILRSVKMTEEMRRRKP